MASTEGEMKFVRQQENYSLAEKKKLGGTKKIIIKN